MRIGIDLGGTKTEVIYVPAHKKISFKPGKILKAELKKEWRIDIE